MLKFWGLLRICQVLFLSLVKLSVCWLRQTAVLSPSSSVTSQACNRTVSALPFSIIAEPFSFRSSS